MSKLFEALRLRDLTLANRIMVSPMCQYSAVDGSGSDWHYAHLGALAGSGAGLVCLEATHVSAVGRITPGCLGLYSDANEAALAPIVRMIRSVSPIKVGVQLAHAGRKGSSRPPWEGGKLLPLENGGWTHEAPSALPHAEGERPPHALTREQVAGVRDAFVASTRRAARLGFDAVELHFAHGYLIHQFLSPVSNQRDDEYGGSFANRVRFPLEVFDAVRAVFPQHLPVGVRVSATDWLDDQPSWDLAQTIELAQLLKARGCDWIDVSSGGISPQQKIVLGPGYQVPFARARARRDRPADRRRRLDHRAAAGRGHRRRRQCRHGGAGARHAVRPALGMARRCGARRHRGRSEAVLALATARGQPDLRRHQLRPALAGRAARPA